MLTTIVLLSAASQDAQGIDETRLASAAQCIEELEATEYRYELAVEKLAWSAAESAADDWVDTLGDVVEAARRGEPQSFDELHELFLECFEVASEDWMRGELRSKVAEKPGQVAQTRFRELGRVSHAARGNLVLAYQEQFDQLMAKEPPVGQVVYTLPRLLTPLRTGGAASVWFREEPWSLAGPSQGAGLVVESRPDEQRPARQILLAFSNTTPCSPRAAVIGRSEDEAVFAVYDETSVLDGQRYVPRVIRIDWQADRHISFGLYSISNIAFDVEPEELRLTVPDSVNLVDVRDGRYDYPARRDLWPRDIKTLLNP